jgi:signal transduction histidine kinase
MPRRWLSLNSPFTKYTLAILLAAGALTLRWFLDYSYPVQTAASAWDKLETAWVAVVISAWFLGLRPGILTAVLTTLGGWYWFLPPRSSFAISSSGNIVALAGFVVICGLTIFITENSRRVRISLRRASEELEQRVEARTAELSAANQNLRDLSARLMQLQDNERRRIARELHDSVGQLLSAASISLSQVAGRVDSQTILAETLELVRSASDQVRTISHLLHPPLLDEIGLKSALSGYIEEFGKRSHIAVAVELPNKLERMTADLETALFRIVQECLTNIHRHSGSPTASVQLCFRGGDICLTIRDSGKGIPAQKIAALSSGGSLGVGFRGMRERVRQLGGKLEFTSDNTGTKITATIPVESAATACAGSA